MEIDEVLIKLARMSPKSYADKIRIRNTDLLSKLALLKPYIGQRVGDISFNRDAIEKNGYVGCPHCKFICDRGGYQCQGCLWTRASGDPELKCIHIKFNGLVLADVQFHNNASIRVAYGSTAEWIELSHCFDTVVQQSHYDKVEKYLQGHVDWANLECWGEEYAVCGFE